jgi:dolichol kinase
VHAASGALGPLAVAVGPAVATPGFAVLVVVAFLAEVARLVSPRAGALVRGLAGGLFRPAEERAPSGAGLLAVGYALAWWLFPPAAAEAGIIVAAVADPAAALAGSRLGRGAAKSLPGSVACACAAALALALLRTPPAGVVAGALGAAAAERVPWRGADNLAVPVAVAAILTVLR